MSLVTTPTETSLNEWTSLEKLLLAQAVVRCGDANWIAVSRTLRQHPCTCARNSEFFSQKNCASKYQHLMDNVFDSTKKKRYNFSPSPDAMKLYGWLFNQRKKELNLLKSYYETRFQNILTEMNEIDGGIGDLKDLYEKGVEEENSLINSPDPLLYPDLIISKHPSIIEQEIVPRKTMQVELNLKLARSILEDSDDHISISDHIKRMKEQGLLKKNIVQVKEDQGAHEDELGDDESEDHHDKKEDEETLKAWKRSILLLWNEISNHRCGPIFLHPVKSEEAPRYLEMIKSPLDLTAIKQKILQDSIVNIDEFHRDILLMVQNALMFNEEDSDIYFMALELKEYAEREIEKFKSTQMLISSKNFVEVPAKRTRSSNKISSK